MRVAFTAAAASMLLVYCLVSSVKPRLLLVQHAKEALRLTRTAPLLEPHFHMSHFTWSGRIDNGGLQSVLADHGDGCVLVWPESASGQSTSAVLPPLPAPSSTLPATPAPAPAPIYVILDGTWQEAESIFRKGPDGLRALPRCVLQPTRPSTYTLRKNFGYKAKFGEAAAAGEGETDGCEGPVGAGLLCTAEVGAALLEREERAGLEMRLGAMGGMDGMEVVEGESVGGQGSAAIIRALAEFQSASTGSGSKRKMKAASVPRASTSSKAAAAAAAAGVTEAAVKAKAAAAPTPTVPKAPTTPAPAPATATTTATATAPTRPFCVYLLQSTTAATYIGATVDLPRRLRQHNRSLAGGARATAAAVRQGGSWRVVLHLIGFCDWRSALQWEWRWKQLSRGRKGAGGRGTGRGRGRGKGKGVMSAKGVAKGKEAGASSSPAETPIDGTPAVTPSKVAEKVAKAPPSPSRIHTRLSALKALLSLDKVTYNAQPTAEWGGPMLVWGEGSGRLQEQWEEEL